MSIDSHAQIRSDRDRADAVLRLCWDNFLATEPTFVLRDLIVVEMEKARERERDKIASWLEANGQPGYAHEIRHLK